MGGVGYRQSNPGCGDHLCRGTEAGKNVTGVRVQRRPARLAQSEGEGGRTWPQGRGVVSGRGLVRSQRGTGGVKEQSGPVRGCSQPSHRNLVSGGGEPGPRLLCASSLPTTAWAQRRLHPLANHTTLQNHRATGRIAGFGPFSATFFCCQVSGVGGVF